MLTLISSRPDTSSELIDQHIADYAPALALSTLATLSGEVSYDSLKKTCTEHLSDWWKLSVPSGSSPSNHYESGYWYLLHLLESLEEHELLGNTFIQFKVSTTAQYLLGITEYQNKMQGTRP
ncbi:hypothetical protein C942_01773 [Photobacterium marinum]|uniref:Uncharacterized protein n=1 Tax=Photobacterium marinum TaxID=1056511 RepID=L8J8S3_9GAMM|nr:MULTISPECIES: hypothetical protein [Photobacterium]ELR65201.1 hypothetical protein C942_01773 [Photobacterium marinum]